MRFSIVTPVFNSAGVIASCVDSVLQQSCRDFEHIIIDNCSTDNTLKLIKDAYNAAGCSDLLRIVSEPDKGIGDAFNKGIHAAAGEYILLLNGDDEFIGPDILKNIDALITATGALILHGDIYFEDTVYGSNLRKPLLCSFKQAMPYNHPGMFIHRSVYERYGVYDPGIKIAMDYEFLLRLRMKSSLLDKKTEYVTSFPLIRVRAGGVSWHQETAGIEDIRLLLHKFNLWDFEAKKYYYLRLARVRIKKILTSLNLQSVIVSWRNRKWNSPA